MWKPIKQEAIELLNIAPRQINYTQGCQKFNIVGNKRIKYDKYSFEGERQSLVETVVSKLLKRTNLDKRNIDVLDYTIGYNQKMGVHYCECELFTNEKIIYVSFDKFLKGIDRLNVFYAYNEEEFEHHIIETVRLLEEVYNLTGIGEYITTLFAIDCLILNIDRHVSNFGVLIDLENFLIKTAPVFDNGMGLKSLHPEVEPIEEIKSSYDYYAEDSSPTRYGLIRQYEIMQSLFPTRLIPYTIQDINKVMENFGNFEYGKHIHSIEELEFVRCQLLVYLEIFSNIAINQTKVENSTDNSNILNLTWK